MADFREGREVQAFVVWADHEIPYTITSNEYSAISAYKKRRRAAGASAHRVHINLATITAGPELELISENEYLQEKR